MPSILCIKFVILLNKFLYTNLFILQFYFQTCFVQVRKKEPPHPIRIAKTIDVIARITFPTAYAIFLIFFFVHYKGFS